MGGELFVGDLIDQGPEKLKIKIFINMDEDDPGDTTKNINLKSLFPEN